MSAIRDAAARAIAFAREVYGDAAVRDPRIEEVEHAGTVWHITLSWTDGSVGGFGVLFGPRIYKQFDANAASGEVTAMRIRKVE